MESHYLSYQKSTIHYLKFGSGSKLLFCFHGYARESGSFLFLEKTMGAKYTIIALDAPFHGLTKWKEQDAIEPPFMLSILQTIKEELNRRDEPFSIMGFSMGGRIALLIAQLIPEQIERLVLIAPDGLNYNFWRWLSTDTIIANRLIAYTTKHPTWAFWVTDKAEKLRLINRNLAEFVRFHLSNEDNRTLLYQQLMANKKLKPDASKLKQAIRKYSIPVRMMFGENDRIVTIAGGLKFRRGIEDYVKVKQVKGGHHLLIESQVANIMELFSH